MSKAKILFAVTGFALVVAWAAPAPAAPGDCRDPFKRTSVGKAKKDFPRAERTDRNNNNFLCCKDNGNKLNCKDDDLD